ncbi:MAG: hypothetical protein E5W30_20365, partial [Mesorhizobium sp.]
MPSHPSTACGASATAVSIPIPISRNSIARAVQRFKESRNRSNFLFLRDSGRKTVTHFSWNCSC